MRLTWVDGDGVVGAASGVSQVKTLSLNPPSTGKTIRVALDGTGDVNNITNALSVAVPGDIISIRPGAYPAFSINKSGLANNYITLQGEGPGVFVSGNGVVQNVMVNASYIRIKNLVFHTGTISFSLFGGQSTSCFCGRLCPSRYLCRYIGTG